MRLASTARDSRRLLRALLGGLGACSALAYVRPATAQTSLHLSGDASIGYTDNMLGTADDPADGAPPPVAVWFSTLTPGLQLYSDSPRSRYLIAYGHPFTFYFGQPDANSDGDVVQGSGIWALSGRDELLLGLGASRTTNALANLQTPVAAGAAQADGRATHVNINATEQWTHAFSERWNGRQTLGYGLVIPTDTPAPEPNRYDINAGLGADYLVGYDSWGFDATVGFFHVDEIDDTPADEQLIVQGIARYRRDLAQDWSSELRGGGGVVNDLDGHTGLVPRWGASLFWNYNLAQASLNYDHAITVNLLTQQAFLADTVTLYGSVPIFPDANILFTTGHGFAWNRLIEDNQALSKETSNSWTSEVALGWYPDYDLPQFTLRYQHFQQFNAGAGQTGLQNLHRNLVMFSVSGRFPPRRIEPIPAQPQRVDGQDRDPFAPSAADAQRNGGGGTNLQAPDANRVPVD
ncbi:MAG: hypothetical protein R3B07_03625 [Polyangiaceae bacterium]